MLSTPDRKRRRTEGSRSPELSLGWADLPADIIGKILEKLTLLADYDRFGAVCCTWRRASLDILNRDRRIEGKISSCSVPFLLLLPVERLSQQEKDKDIYKGHEPWGRSLFDVVGSTTLPEFRIPSFPNNSMGRCCGSSHGWLIFADSSGSLTLTLVHPFRVGGGSHCGGGVIRLPPIFNDRDDDNDEPEGGRRVYEFVELEASKVMLSADPAMFPDDYVVSVIVGMTKSLLFIRPGDTTWSLVPFKRKHVFRHGVDDVLFRNGAMYAVMNSGAIYFVSTTDRVPKMRKVAPPPPIRSSPDFSRYYIVESPEQGELFIDRRSLASDGVITFRTTTFEVFKLLVLGGRLTGWRRMINLGNNAFVLGENKSTCIRRPTSHDLPGFQANSIYFTDDCLCSFANNYFDVCKPYTDMGIFNMKDGAIQQCYDLANLSELVCIPPPIWFFPSLPGNWARDRL